MDVSQMLATAMPKANGETGAAAKTAGEPGPFQALFHNLEKQLAKGKATDQIDPGLLAAFFGQPMAGTIQDRLAGPEPAAGGTNQTPQTAGIAALLQNNADAMPMTPALSRMLQSLPQGTLKDVLDTLEAGNAGGEASAKPARGLVESAFASLLSDRAQQARTTGSQAGTQNPVADATSQKAGQNTGIGTAPGTGPDSSPMAQKGKKAGDSMMKGVEIEGLSITRKATPNQAAKPLHQAPATAGEPTRPAVEANGAQQPLAPQAVKTAATEGRANMEHDEKPTSRPKTAAQRANVTDNLAHLQNHQADKTAAQPKAGDIRLPSGQTVSESHIVEQVANRLLPVRPQEAGRIHIKMHPAELGEVKLDLTLDHDRVKAQLVTHSQQVQDVLERHMPRLRDALQQHGFKLDQLQVSVDAQAQGGRHFSQHQQQSNGQAHRWSPPAETIAADAEVPPAPRRAPTTNAGLSLRV